MKDMEINEKIRYFRKQRGLSQELLAERTGINVNTIRKYEIGIRKPKVEQLKKIADGLEISVIEFLDIEIENEADLIAMLKKISPFFKWDGLLHVLEGKSFYDWCWKCIGITVSDFCLLFTDTDSEKSR